MGLIKKLQGGGGAAGLSPEMFGCTKMSVVEYDSGYSNTVSVAHGLGEKPKFVYTAIKTRLSYPGYYPVRMSCVIYSNSTGTIKTPVTVADGFSSGYPDVAEAEGTITADSTYANIDGGYGFPSATYILITMA